MTKVGKSNVLILGILTAMFAGTTGVGFYLEEQERKGRLRLEQHVSQLTQQKQQLEQALDTAQQEKTRLQEDMAAAQEEARRLTAKVNELAESHESLQGALQKREETLDTLSEELEQIQAERAQLNTELTSVQAQVKKLETQLVRLKQERGDLQAQLEQMQGQAAVDLEKVVVTPQTPAAPPPLPSSPFEPVTGSGTVTGRILVVNREYDFVVMNVGKANGVKIGDAFDISRNGQQVGQVKVEKVYEALSAAALLPGTEKGNLHEGDTARLASGSAN